MGEKRKQERKEGGESSEEEQVNAKGVVGLNGREGTEATKQRQTDNRNYRGGGRKREKKMTEGHTETRRKEVAEYVGTVQYVVVIDGGGRAAVLVTGEETTAEHQK